MRTQAQADEHCRQVFAQIDTTQDARGVREQLAALGFNRDQRKNLLRRAIDLGILHQDQMLRRAVITEGPTCEFCRKHYTMPASRNKHERGCPQRQGRPLPVRPDFHRDRHEAFEERVRLLCKELDRNRPVAPQARELGIGESIIYRYVAAAKEMGLIEPSFRFPGREPADRRPVLPPMYGPPKPKDKPPPKPAPKPAATPLTKLTYLPPAHRCETCGYEASNTFRFGKHKCVPDDEDV